MDKQEKKKRAGERSHKYLLPGRDVFLTFAPLPNPERAHPRLAGRNATIQALRLLGSRFCRCRKYVGTVGGKSHGEIPENSRKSTFVPAGLPHYWQTPYEEGNPEEEMNSLAASPAGGQTLCQADWLGVRGETG